METYLGWSWMCCTVEVILLQLISSLFFPSLFLPATSIYFPPPIAQALLSVVVSERNSWGMCTDAFGAQPFTEGSAELHNTGVLCVRAEIEKHGKPVVPFSLLLFLEKWLQRSTHDFSCHFVRACESPVTQQGLLSFHPSQASWGLAQSTVTSCTVILMGFQRNSWITGKLICCEEFFIKTPRKTTVK